MGYTWETEKKIYIYTVLLALLAAVASLIFMKDPKPMLTGLAFGTIISILNFRNLALTLQKAVQMPKEKAQAYAASRYVTRFVISAVVIFVSVKADYINTLGTVTGMILIKLVIVTTNLFNDMDYYKRIFKRKEEK